MTRIHLILIVAILTVGVASGFVSLEHRLAVEARV